MAFISRDFISELINRIDIVALIHREVPLKKTGRNYAACCPFHSEKTPSFIVFPQSQSYHCFGCGAHGRAIEFMMHYAQLSYVEAIHQLAAHCGVTVVYEGDKHAVIPQRQPLYHVMTQAAEYYQQQLWQHQPAIDYLKKRGLSEEIIAEFGIGYAPHKWDNVLKIWGKAQHAALLEAGLIVVHHKTGGSYDRFRQRIMFPLYDQQGRVIAFGGRVLDASQPKYLNSPETPLFQKGRELYNWYLTRKVRPLETVIIVEGYLDVLALAQHGIRHAVASMGTALSETQLNRLFRSVAEVVFCFDGDAAGHKAAWRSLETVLPLLHAGRQVRFMFLPAELDPDSFIRQYGASGFHQQLAQAQPLSTFLFDTLRQQADTATAEGRAAFQELAMPFLQRLPQGDLRNFMINELKAQIFSTQTRQNQQRSTTLVSSNSISASRKGLVNNKNNNFIALSLIHKAIVCLLQQPELAQAISEGYQKLADLRQNDVTILIQIIELIKKKPQVDIETLCEHWRDSATEQLLNQLLRQKNGFLIKKDIDLAAELNDALKQLERDYDKQRFEFLTQKGSLTTEEKQELQTLLRLS